MKDNIQREIEKLEEEEFILSMKDTWDESDYRESRERYQKILELKGLLKNENK